VWILVIVPSASRQNEMGSTDIAARLTEQCTPSNICDALEPLFSTWSPIICTMVIYFLGVAQINAGVMCMLVRAVTFRLLPALYSAEFVSQIRVNDEHISLTLN
jgi:hypothetical protein